MLHDALGFRTAEVAEMLDTSEASVKGALQRARAAVDERLPQDGRDRAALPSAARERELAGRFAVALEHGHTDAIVSPIARAYGLMALTLTYDRISAITWFGERSLLAHFGLPRTLPE